MSLVSVVIPCFRHEKYVKGCLDSVYNQSYRNIELIVIDDLSPDNTFSIVNKLCSTKKYLDRFDRIIVRQNAKNIGAHATINNGINIASGEYISLLNSDDQYHVNRIDKMVLALINGESDFCFSNYVFIDDESEEVHFNPLYLELQSWILLAKNNYPSIGYAFLQRQIALSTGNFIFKKSLYNKIGRFLDLKYCHDWDFVLQAIRYCDPIFVDYPYYRYRIHNQNSFRSLDKLANIETEFVLTRFFKECELSGVSNYKCPTSSNWPGVFEFFLTEFGLDEYYTRAISSYNHWHKVIDDTAMSTRRSLV